MSDGGVRVESGEDRNLCRTSSRETGTGSFSVRQDGGSSDDSELYDTDVESAACEASSAGRTSGVDDRLHVYFSRHANALESRGNYSATSNYTKLVHWA